MKPRAIVMGSGTSNGVPSLGRTYPPEFLADPRNHRTRCSLMLQGPTGNVLVDCSPEMRLQVLRTGVTEIEAVIISHTHADHVMGMDDLRSFSLATGEAVPVYTSPQYQEDIRRLFPYAFAEFPPDIFVPKLDLRDLPERLDLAGLDIEVLWVRHGPWDVAAVRTGGFAYVTDVSEIPPKAWERLRGLDTLVLDAVRHRPHPNHFHLDRAIEVAQALAPRTTYFTHLCDEYDHGPAEMKLPKGIRLAYDGLTIPI
ncbi:MAG: MBL fold metallo-hydrolase [Fimbriimonadaceae bacterium]|nr:MBL fold metallo-hydrolase [Fimbriimonadaceae bacterium]